MFWAEEWRCGGLKYPTSQAQLCGSGMKASEGPAEEFELDPGVVLGSPKSSVKGVTSSAVYYRTVSSSPSSLCSHRELQEDPASLALAFPGSLAFCLVLLSFPFSAAENQGLSGPHGFSPTSPCRSGLGVGSSLSHLRAAVGVRRPRAHAHQRSDCRQGVGTGTRVDSRGGACSTRRLSWGSGCLHSRTALAAVPRAGRLGVFALGQC